MKKFYVLLAVAAMLASCAETDLVNPIPESEPEAIGFETFAQKATKATENSEEGYAENDLANHHTTFKVWASKQLADDSYVEVYAAAHPGTVKYTTEWTADSLKYWDKAASNYYFYAAAPATDVSWSYLQVTNGSDGYLQLTDYTLTGTNIATGSNTDLINKWKEYNGDKDLMIAAECIVENDNYNKANPDAVNLDFIHILSKLNIAVKKNSDATIILKKLDVCKLKKGGSFNENAELGTDTLSKGTTKRWNTESSEIYTLPKAGDDLTLTADAVYTHEYLIMPQLQLRQNDCKGLGTAPANDAYIYIEYTVDGETFKAFYGLAEVFGISMDANLAFNEGWQNTLTISIEPDAITFTGDVAVWDDNIGSGSLEIE